MFQSLAALSVHPSMVFPFGSKDPSSSLNIYDLRATVAVHLGTSGKYMEVLHVTITNPLY